MTHIRPILSVLSVTTVVAAALAVSPAAAHSQSQASRDDAAMLLRLECELSHAAVRRDPATSERLFAADYTSVGPDGSTSDRAGDLRALMAGKLIFSSIAMSGIRSRLYGDAAVITGQSHVTGTYNEQDVSGSYQWTDTWIRRSGGWQLVATQVTPVANAPRPAPQDACAAR